MSKKDFDTFLSVKEREREDIPKIDWEVEKYEWLSYLDKLYKIFAESLKDYVKKGKIKLDCDKTITLTEEDVGKYEAKTMIIEFAGEKIILEPIGTNLIGVKGRVDMIGRFASAKIVLVDSRMKGLNDHIKAANHGRKESPEEAIIWEWKFVMLPSRLYLPVNEDTIYSVIMELSNG
jgi:hypothetical protein